MKIFGVRNDEVRRWYSCIWSCSRHSWSIKTCCGLRDFIMAEPSVPWRKHVNNGCFRYQISPLLWFQSVNLKNTNKWGWVVSICGTIQPHIVLCLLSMLQTPIRSEKRIRVNQRIQLIITLFSLFIHDDLLVENSVSSVEIHNPTLI